MRSGSKVQVALRFAGCLFAVALLLAVASAAAKPLHAIWTMETRDGGTKVEITAEWTTTAYRPDRINLVAQWWLESLVVKNLKTGVSFSCKDPLLTLANPPRKEARDKSSQREAEERRILIAYIRSRPRPCWMHSPCPPKAQEGPKESGRWSLPRQPLLNPGIRHANFSDSLPDRPVGHSYGSGPTLRGHGQA